MMTNTANKAKPTPLAAAHRASGARMIEFAGWSMPVRYAGILAEHRAVRRGVGLFDLSHMGEIELSGPRVDEVCRELFVTDTNGLAIGRAQYSLMCAADGGILDDVIVYRLEEHRYFVCVNAANTAADFAWMTETNRGRAAVADRSDETALVALQGPRSAQVLSALTAANPADIRRYRAAQMDVAGVPALVARTGYTGEDGFELFVPAQRAERVWDACREAGRAADVRPVGLGARDTLRLEAGYLLYGNDMDARTTPLEAGLHGLLRSGDGSFIGCAALDGQRRRGVHKRLVGLRVEGPGIPRRGYAIRHAGTVVGEVTSGTQSPMLGVGIALGYVRSASAAVGTRIDVTIRARHVPATIVERPFYPARG